MPSNTPGVFRFDSSFDEMDLKTFELYIGPGHLLHPNRWGVEVGWLVGLKGTDKALYKDLICIL